MKFNKTIVLKPNGLMGERAKPRTYEKWLIPVFIFFTKLLSALKKYRPIQGKQVAQILRASYIEIMKSPTNLMVLQREELDRYVNNLNKKS